jgi:hypothetical protein
MKRLFIFWVSDAKFIYLFFFPHFLLILPKTKNKLNLAYLKNSPCIVRIIDLFFYYFIVVFNDFAYIKSQSFIKNLNLNFFP